MFLFCFILANNLGMDDAAAIPRKSSVPTSMEHYIWNFITDFSSLKARRFAQSVLTSSKISLRSAPLVLLIFEVASVFAPPAAHSPLAFFFTPLSIWADGLVVKEKSSKGRYGVQFLFVSLFLFFYLRPST